MKINDDKDLKSEFEQRLQEKTRQNQDIDSLSGSRTDTPDRLHREHREETTDKVDTTEKVDKTIPIIEERVEVGKRVVETGDVYISKSVHEDRVTVDLPTTRQHVQVERVPVNQYVDTPPAAVRHEGDTMIIPVIREELVVVKKLFVVEELHITKKSETIHGSEQVTLLKEEVHVNRVANDTPRR